MNPLEVIAVLVATIAVALTLVTAVAVIVAVPLGAAWTHLLADDETRSHVMSHGWPVRLCFYLLRGLALTLDNEDDDDDDDERRPR